MRALRNKYLGIVAFCTIISLLISGCGAIMHGSRQEITINSSPSEATTKIMGEDRTTPAVYNLKRKNNYIIKISKEGYEPAEVMINHKLGWTAWADLFILGVIPIFYDLGTGAAYKLSPEEVNVNLTRSLGNLEGPETISVGLKVEDDNLIHVSDEPVNIEIIEVN